MKEQEQRGIPCFESFLYARHRSKHFTWVILFYPRKRENDRLERQEGRVDRKRQRQGNRNIVREKAQRYPERNREP